MLRPFVKLFLALSLLASPDSAAFAEKVALVIGNGAYVNAPALTNPKNDAEDMAAALKKLGFKVILGIDLDKRAMDGKILEFANALSSAETGVFHYSGHGLQVGGVNYLVPVDAKLETAAALDFEAVRLDLVQRTMERETKTNILFLDACRNNPLTRNLARALGTRSADIGRGLAATEAGAGTLISFSTQPGNVALDGSGRNSPYSGPLVKAIGTAGEDILSVLTSVRNAVMAATKDQQVPWDNNALRAKFYFNPSAPAANAPQPPLSEAGQTWLQIKDQKDPNVFEAFRRQYGSANPVYDALASQRIEELKNTKTASEGGSSSSWWPWSSGQHPEAEKPKETQTAIVSPPKPVAKPPDYACDGSLVAVSQPGTGPPCIKPGSGESFKDCSDCPEMVIVPSGLLTMGSTQAEIDELVRQYPNDGYKNEGPEHRITIPKPFAVGKFAVTFSEWDACVAAGGCGGYWPGDLGWGRGDRPVINVSWNDAESYVAWLLKKTGQPYRLLSEAEREYAARAGTATPFWWGSSVTTGQANYNGNYTYEGGSKGEYRQKTVPVKSFERNPWGLYQVHGNVYDWVEDCYNDSYNGAPVDGSAWTTGECKYRVLRGGSWYSLPQLLRAAYCKLNYPSYRSYTFGFRVARTITP